MPLPVHPVIEQAVQRYIGYGWGNAIILDLIRFRFNVRLSSRCVNNLRNDSPCTKQCRENCWLK